MKSRKDLKGESVSMTMEQEYLRKTRQGVQGGVSGEGVKIQIPKCSDVWMDNGVEEK